jgi:hypothetical protein
MSDPRGEYGLIDFYAKRGFAKVIVNDHAQSAHAGGAEANLSAYVIPANTLLNDGDALLVTVKGSFAANANAKRLRVLLGALVGLDSVSSVLWNGHQWTIQVLIHKTGATAQKAIGLVLAATVTGAEAVLGTSQAPTTGAEDPKTALTLAIKGTGVAGSDVVQESCIVEYLAEPQ